jgi:hypothetical protein
VTAGEGTLRGRNIVSRVSRPQTTEPPFSYPAVAVEDDIVACLEAEPLQGNEDANGNGESSDTILRVYRLNADGAEELTAGRPPGGEGFGA